ncbi:MAG TPA: glycosyltransferase [Terriglobia bacterium]|nr:glycosyltransferase [Terriglobia bacterium]
MQNLLILSSDTGEGHNSAASAIAAAGIDAGFHVSVRKPLEESGGWNRALGNLYNTLLQRCPQWMGAYYSLIERWRPNERDLFYARVRGYIGDFLDLEKPDILLSVHPMLNHFIQRFIKEENRDIPCYTFLTDPFPPFWRGWASPYVDRYFVATDEALQSLTAMDVPAWRIERAPMPVRPQFAPSSEATADLRRELGLDESSVILVNGGARGGGPILDVVNTVRRAAWNTNVLVICGKNLRLRHAIERIEDQRTRVFGFVEDIHRYIAAADLVLTKPGALATFETLACGVPVLLLGTRGLMPQESGLFRAARRYEFGFGASTLGEIARIVEMGPPVWNALRSSIAHFYRFSSGSELIERMSPGHAA